MSKLGRRGALFTGLVLEVFKLNRLLLDAGDAVAAPAGLTSARWQVLGVVEHGPVSVADVARTMGLKRQSVQEVAHGLAATEMIEWLDNPKHQKSKLMRLTRKGKKAMELLAERHADWANALAAAHPARSLAAALETLVALRKRLEGT
ncbi:MAG TPA: MarR family transcriptional regulator [Polyangiaceae bacterium]